MNYADLRKDIETFTSNTDPDFLGSIDRFIRQSENLIATSVRLPSFTTSLSFTLLSGTATLSAPSDFISVDSIYILGSAPMEKKDPGFIYEAYPDAVSMGQPRYFGMLDDSTILWGPTPALPYSAVMRYFSYPVSIVDQRTATYIANRFEVALLNGALMFAAIFMKDAEMKAQHEDIFMNSLGLAKTMTKGRLTKQTFEKSNAAIDSGEIN